MVGETLVVNCTQLHVNKVFIVFNVKLMLNNVTDNFTCEIWTEFSKCGIKIHFFLYFVRI